MEKIIFTPNSKLVLSIFLVFTISFFLLYLLFELNYTLDIFNYQESFQESFFSQINAQEKKIYILGSSQVLSIDPSVMEKILYEKNIQLNVYNLAVGR